MKQTQSLKEVLGVKTEQLIFQYKQRDCYREEMTHTNLDHMPALLLYFTLAFFANLLFNAWLRDSPIAFHDGFFSLITVFFWILYLAYLQKKIQSERAKRWLYGSFWIISDLYLLIFIGLEIMENQSVYNYLFGMFVIAIVPLLTPLQSILTILLNMAFAVLFIIQVDNGHSLIAFVLASSAFALIISLREFFSFLRIHTVHERLLRMGERDHLTGLFNRNIMDSYVENLWRKCAEKNSALIAAMIDIDYFKKYNDTYGHLKGDQCLKKIADCIRQATWGELSLRYGGEEFVIFFSDMKQDAVTRILEHIQLRIAQLDITSGVGLSNPKVTVSIGVAQIIPSFDNSVDHLLKEADRQLYLAKEKGRNRICGF